MSRAGSKEAKPYDPPPGWAVTDRPMTIAFIGWARLGLQGKEGSGYNLSASDLASGLALSGHRVVYLRSGFEYSFRPRPFIRKFETWRGIDCYHLFNSPNLAPALFNFKNMDQERSCPKQISLVLRWLDEQNAQSVHIHSLEGFSIDLVGAIRRTGRPVVITTHNYWPVCPQVDLLYNETHVCTDYQGGKRCESCFDPAPPFNAKMRRRIEQTALRRLGAPAANLVRALMTTRVKLKRGELRANGLEPDDAPPDDELALGFDVQGDRSHDGTLGRRYDIDPEELPPELGRSPIDQNERFLGATHHLTVLNDYGKRRVEGVEMLNEASLVTPPSGFMCRVYESMGVRPERLRQVRLGQPHFDAMNRRTRRWPYYKVRPWDPESARRPLRLAFFGTVRHNKGLDVLVRAIPLLEPDIRRRCQFLIRAAGPDAIHRKRLASYPEVSFLGGYDTDQLLAATGEFDVGILPFVWFENSPLVLLEFLHAGKFVISSRLGGPPEWVVEPGSEGAEANGGLGNGLLFPGGDPEALAERIRRVATGEVTLPSPAEVHAVSKLHSYPDHVREVESIHRELLEGSGAEKGAAERADQRGHPGGVSGGPRTPPDHMPRPVAR